MVQSNSGFATGGTNPSVAFLNNNASGNLLWVAVGSDATITAPTDTLGNTYTLAISVAGSGGSGNAAIYYVASSLPGANTVTCNHSGNGDTHCHIAEVSGLVASSPLDQTGRVASSSSCGVSTSGATSQANEWIGAFFYDSPNSKTLIAGTGYTGIQLSNDTNSGDSALSETQNSGSAAVQTATCGGNSNNILSQLITTFKASGSGSGPFISSLSPATGSSGTLITMSGSNFGPSQGTSTVTFNGDVATPTSWGSGSIQVPVPAGATTGNVVVTVAGTESNGVNFTVPPGPAIVVQSKSGFATGGSNPSVAFPNKNTAGNLIWVAVGSDATITPPSDTLGNSYSLAVEVNGSGGSGNAAIYYASPARAGTNTVTCNHSGNGNTHCHIAEVTGLSPSSPLDQAGSVASSSTCAVSTAAATSQANEWVAAFFYDSPTSKTMSAGNGYSKIQLSTDNSAGDSALSEGEDVTATGVQTATCSGNSSNVLSQLITTFTAQSNTTNPLITGLSPTSGAVGTVVTVSGSNFGNSQGSSTVTFNGVAATPTNWSNLSITVPVPSGATTGEVVVTVGGNASNGVNFTVLPAISDFNPKSAPIGATITLTGTTFNSAGSPQITLNQQGGGAIAAPVVTFSASTLSFVIPSGAASGQVTLTTGSLSTVSSATLNITASSSFSVSAGPASASVQQGNSVSYSVSLSSSNGFSQLAALSVTGVPSGVTASFSPVQITAAQTSILTVSAPANQPLGTSALTISAAATLQGISTTQSASVNLTVQAVSTSLIGRVVESDNNETPIPGIAITFLGVDDAGNQTGCSGWTTSDAAGNFSFTNLSSSCLGRQLVWYNGDTATDGNQYAGVNLAYTIVQNQITGPELVHLPAINNAETILVQQNATVDQVFSYATIPGVTVTVYAGTTLTLPDGTQPNPFPMAAVIVPVDRLPDAPTPTAGVLRASIVAFQPANTTTSLPVSVSFPNVVNTPPGVNMELDTLDPIVGELVKYGTGTVSGDGTKIVPDPDPAHPGHRFGISHFDWHGPMTPAPNGNNPSPDPHSPKNGDPVDTATGLLNFTKTDIGFGGARGAVSIQRTYRTLSGAPGPFGVGTNHNYGYLLDTSNIIKGTGSFLNLVMPDGNQFAFVQVGANTFVNSTIPSLLGAVFTSASTTTYNLRWKDGTLWQFQTSNQGALEAFLGSITDANGNTITLVRGNPAQPLQITQIIDPVGRALNLTYDNFNRILSITDPIGRTVQYTYNSQGTLATVTDPAGGVTTYGYDSQNRMTSIADPRGITYLQNTYDANGRVIQQTAADGGVTTFTYTLLNSLVPTSPVLLTTVTDSLGNATTYHFSPQGFLQDVTDALGQKTIYTIDPGTNLLLGITGPLGRTTSYTYDALGNMTSTTRLAGASDAVTTTYSFDPVFSKITGITDPLGNATFFSYDSSGNLTGITDPLNEKTTFTYDDVGELASTVDPLGNVTKFTYSNGNLERVVDPLGRISTRVADGVGRLTAATDPLGHTRQYQFNALNQVTEMTDPVGNSTTLAYDANGNLLDVTDALGHKSSYTYDSMDRLASYTDPLSNSETYAYDRDNNLTQFTDRRGVVTKYTYDALNRRSVVAFGNESSISYSYDVGSRLVSATDSVSGTVIRGYDQLDRLITEKSPEGSVGFSYDAAGRRTGLTVEGQSAVQFSYDNANRVTQITRDTSTITFTYDQAGRRASMTLPNGILAGYRYDAGSQLQSISYSLGSSSLGTQAYTYDQLGRRTNVGGSLAGTNLPPTLTTTSYNAANELTTFGSSNLAYDANGNLTSDGSSDYSWDARNHLASISGSVSASFVYDAFGRRVQRTIAGNTTTFLYDGVRSVQELSGSLVTANLLVGGVDEVFQRTDSSGAQSLLTDVLGSTLALTGSSGAIQTTYTFDPFGNTTSSGAPTTNSVAFTGRELDTTGLYYYRARYYSPKLHRFISMDPAGLNGGDTNLYIYASDNPITFRDPSGRNPLCIIGGLLGSIGYSGYVIYQELSGRKLDYYSGWSGVGHILSGQATAFGAGCAAGFGLGGLAGAGEGAAVATEAEAAEATEAEAAEAAEAESSDPCALCFPGGTPVQTRNGLTMIENINIGDEVLSRNRTSGELEYKTVVALTKPHLSRLLSLQFSTDSNPLLVTPEHPLFVAHSDANSADWLRAAQIRVGDLVLTKDGQWVAVTATHAVEEIRTVYNFEVEDNHDYFVGATGFLVHNDGPCDPNKLNHIFNNPDHNLDSLVNQLGGQENAYNALESAVQSQGLPNGVFSTVVDVGGSQVTITGIVINGIARIGTAFIP